MRIILELLRITVICLLLGAVLGGLVKLIYSGLGINIDYTPGAWIVGCAILVFLFVFYRNKLQFSGFYKSEGMVKLPRKVSIFLLSFVVILLIVAPFFR